MRAGYRFTGRNRAKPRPSNGHFQITRPSA
jgi:hypothetical protein